MTALPNVAWRILAAVAWMLVLIACVQASAPWPNGSGFVVAALVVVGGGFAVTLPDSAWPSVVTGALGLWWIVATPVALPGTMLVALALGAAHGASAWAAALPARGATTQRAQRIIGSDLALLGSLTVASAGVAAIGDAHARQSADGLVWLVAGIAVLAGLAWWLARRPRE